MSSQSNDSLRRTVRIAGALGAVALAISLFVVWEFWSQDRDEAKADAEPYVTIPLHTPSRHTVKLSGKVVRLRIRHGLRRRYRLVDLGPIDDDSGDTSGDEITLNDRGTVTLSLYTSVFLWKNGKRTKLPGYSDYPYMAVNAVNNHDIAVGGIYEVGEGGDEQTSAIHGHPIEWDHGVIAGEIPALPGFGYSYATDINDQGVALCNSDPGTGEENADKLGDAYVWRNGKTIDLGNSEGYAINNRNEVAGMIYVSSYTRSHAALWAHRHWIDLGSVIHGDSETFDLNDRGDVVGDGNQEAFLWRKGRHHSFVAYDLGPGKAHGINDRGEIVGQDNHDNALLWWGGRVVDLNQCISAKKLKIWLLEYAMSINRRGWIVGIGNRFGKEHGILLIPE